MAEQFQVDLVTSGTLFEKGMTIPCYDGFLGGLYLGEQLHDLCSHLFYTKNNEVGIRPNLTNKLFLTTILKKVQEAIPDDISNGEDRICTMTYMLEAKSIYILRKAFYHYIFYSQSMSNMEDPYYLDKLGKVYRYMRAQYSHPRFTEELKVQCELYVTQMVLRAVNEHLGFRNKGIMWISPGWIKQIPKGSRVILYGAGNLGKLYYRHIVYDSCQRLSLMGWIDQNFEIMKEYPIDIQSPECLGKMDFDYILIAVMDRKPAYEIKEELISQYGIEREKIIWIEQREAFWDFAEAFGLLRSKQDNDTREAFR